MDGDDSRQKERQGLLSRLLDAVKQCQVRFGGRSELATDSDSRVSCLCATWEAALQHGMKKNKALSALRHVTEKAGLGKVSGFLSEGKQLDTEPAFWQYVREHLTKHEIQRFNTLKQIHTDMGRGRAWLRACLNEHSLERYMHMLIEKDYIIKQYYHDWAFMCDQERNSMLPTMSAGLGSILFAITIDRPELNRSYHSTLQVGHGGEIAVPGTADNEPRAVIAESSSPIVQRKEKKKKKKITNVVSFDDDDISQRKPRRHSSRSDRTADSILHHSDSNNTTASEILVYGQAEEPSSIYSTGNSDDLKSPIDIACMTLQPQLSVASTSSVFSPTAPDEVSNTGSAASVDGDICIYTPVRDTDDTTLQQRTSFSSDIIHSDASSEISMHSHTDMNSAVLALAAAQKGFESTRSEGDGGSFAEVSESPHQHMSHDDLRQAVVAMMLRKDEIEEQNRLLQSQLQQEMETSSMLRADIAKLKQSTSQRQEADKAKIDKLQSENELLKHQLKKYVNAVQLLRTEGTNSDDGLGIHLDDTQPSIPPPKPVVDYSQEASEYEQKLVQVAEMHGELMEFNEQLHRQLCAKDSVLEQLRQELVTLRGPLPYSEHEMEESTSVSLESLVIQGKTLINIWIPSAFLWGTPSDQYHVYQVYVRIKDEEWNVFRRFSQFVDLHARLKKVYPVISKFDFPPKKSVGKKDVKVVEARRQAFQVYLRNVINVLLEKNPDLSSVACKSRLVALLPFFGEQADATNKKGKKQGQLQSSPSGSGEPTRAQSQRS